MMTMTLTMMIMTLITIMTSIMIMSPWKTTRLVIGSADIAGIVIIRVAGEHSLMLLWRLMEYGNKRVMTKRIYRGIIPTRLDAKKLGWLQFLLNACFPHHLLNRSIDTHIVLWDWHIFCYSSCSAAGFEHHHCYVSSFDKGSRSWSSGTSSDLSIIWDVQANNWRQHRT